MSDQDLSKSIANLARSSPMEFKVFMQEYRAYSDRLANQLVSSPLETLQLAQGRARLGVEFLRILEGALSAEKRKTP